MASFCEETSCLGLGPEWLECCQQEEVSCCSEKRTTRVSDEELAELSKGLHLTAPVGLYGTLRHGKKLETAGRLEKWFRLTYCSQATKLSSTAGCLAMSLRHATGTGHTTPTLYALLATYWDTAAHEN